MSVGSVSFWRQDQNYWVRSEQDAQTQALSAAVISQMFNATTTRSNGLSSIANQTALSRVNTQLTAAVQNALQGPSGSSSTSSSASSSSTSSSAAPAIPSVTFSAPATGTGTVPLTTGTSLFALGILAKGTVKVGDGTFTTTYTSTGTDTVGDLVNAINANVAGHASVAAWLDSSGKLVITGKNDTASLTVAGSYAAAVGFGAGNNSFHPTTASSSTSSSSKAAGSSSTAASSSASNAGASSSGGASSTGGASAAASRIAKNSAFALQTVGTAELLLAGSGVAGSILNMLA